MVEILNQRRWSVAVVALPLLCFSLNCSSRKYYVRRPLVTEENDTENIPKPKEDRVSFYGDAIDKIFGNEIDEFVNVTWHVRKLTNHHKQAKNINALGEVPNSSWFTNRNGAHPMSLEALKRGPNRGSGPDLSGLLTIISVKGVGKAPGFVIKDRRKDVYILRFDPRGFPQLNTAAEIIATKFVYGAGYNTPETYLCAIDAKQLRIGEHVLIRNRWGRNVPMKYEDLGKILDQAEPNPDGTYRALAAKSLHGERVGPFRYNSVRKDDANEHISHHHRRELRGYKVIAAWLNLFDTMALNTLDLYVTENGKRFLRHYITGLASSLGSDGTGPAPTSRGHEGGFDLGKIALRMFTLGLWVRAWEKEPKIITPSVGYFESRLFNPGNYKFVVPNPAFQKATELDEFWGAKVVMSFTDEQIRAIVETGQYARPQDREYVIRTLVERRDKTGRYWYGKVNPLDDFRFTPGEEEHQGIEFVDLAVQGGFEKAAQTYYRYKLKYRDQDLTDYFVVKARPYLSLEGETKQAIENFPGHIREEERIWTFKIQTKRGEHGSWGKYLELHFYYPSESTAAPQIVALTRQN
ncbi:MAG: hypothetical protein ACE5HO_01550 [bacterium]